MKTQPHGDPGLVTLTRVARGESVTVGVVGGFVRRPAPANGFEVRLNGSVGFVSLADLRAAPRRKQS